MVEIMHPATGKKTDAIIEVYGIETKEYRSAHTDFVIASMTSRSIDDKDKKTEAIEKAAVIFIAKITKSWDGLTNGGKEYECTFDNAVKLYTDARYIFEQIDKHMNNRGNFYKEQKTA